MKIETHKIRSGRKTVLVKFVYPDLLPGEVYTQTDGNGNITAMLNDTITDRINRELYLIKSAVYVKPEYLIIFGKINKSTAEKINRQEAQSISRIKVTTGSPVMTLFNRLF